MSELGEIGALAIPTPLSRRIGPDPHPDALRAFARAREIFISGERIDMGGLAAELGVDRTSLFRWVGNRDALLSEVLWSLAVSTLNQADGSTHEHGTARIAHVLSRFVESLITAQYFRDFLQREPARALRVLTTKDSEIHRRYVAVATHLIREELGDRPFGALDAPELAYLLVRVSESFTYADLITGEKPDPPRADSAFDFVLRRT